MVAILWVFATATHRSTLRHTKMRHSYTVMPLQHHCSVYLLCISTTYSYCLHIIASTTYASWLRQHTRHTFHFVIYYTHIIASTTYTWCQSVIYYTRIIPHTHHSLQWVICQWRIKGDWIWKKITAPSRQDETWHGDQNARQNPEMVQVDRSFQMSPWKETCDDHSGFHLAFWLTISSLIFSGMGCKGDWIPKDPEGILEHLYICAAYIYWQTYHRLHTYGVVLISRLLNIIGLFCKRAL